MKKLILAAAALLAGCGPPTHDVDRSEVLAANSASIFRNVLQKKCIACHNPIGPARFLDLSSREAIWAARDRDFAGGDKLLDLSNPANSYLIKVIRDPVEPMPPKSSSFKAVEEREIEFLEEWIARGLPE